MYLLSQRRRRAKGQAGCADYFLEVPLGFGIYISASRQHGIGNAISSVIVFENGLLLLLSCCCWNNSGWLVTVSRSEVKASEP